jgi:hypothetical protein
MQSSVNFLLLFDQIGHYLAKAPNASQQELETAKVAFDTIYNAFYPKSCAICPDHVVRKNF